MSILSGLEPKEFFQYYEEISAIPRGSYHEEKISNYLKDFAESRGMVVEQDKYFNLLIKKKGSVGYENASPLLLHGHMDMVLDKEEWVDQDMLKEGVRLVIDGDFIRADGTTLGADNGVGVAIIMSILGSTDLPHPPIEAIVTVQEEVGKVGASTFNASNVTGKRLMDFNWHNPHSIFAGCAGDISAYFDIPIKKITASDELKFYKLMIHNLVGGHSEFDVHLERANAIVSTARILNSILLKKKIFSSAFDAGVNRYVIPNLMEIVIGVNAIDADEVAEIVERTAKELKNEYAIADPNLTVEFVPTEKVDMLISPEDTSLIVRCISLLPNGVQSMSLSIEGLVESSNTIAMLETTEDKVRVLSTIPSAVTSRRYNILQQMKNLASLTGATVETFADCPEWPYNPESKLLATAKKAYKDLFGGEAEVEVSHSSLELGLLHAKIPGIEMISLGAEAYDVHTTKERLAYKTVAPVWEMTKEILKNLKD